MVRRLQAVALAAGAGGVALALVLASGGGGGPRPLPVLGLETAAAPESAGDADMSGASTMRAAAVRYEAGELPDISGDARAWVTRKGDPSGRLATLMDALDLSGSPERTEFGWRVVDGDRRLELNDVPGLPWSFWREIAYPETGGGVDGSAGSTGSGEATGGPVDPAEEPATDEPTLEPDRPVSSDEQPVPEPVPAPEPERPADLPSAEESRAIALPVLRAAGVDVDSAAVRVDDGFSVWIVTADPIVGGLPTVGYGSTVSVGPKGSIDWASGWLAPAEGADTYPLVGTDAALERLRQQAGPQILIDDATGAEPAAGEPEPDVAIAPAPEGCAADADCPEPEPMVVRVTNVRLGLLFMPFYEGEEAWLVPAYLFELDGGEGGEMPIVGVPDEHIVQPPAVEPMPAEDPAPDSGQTEPGNPGVETESKPVEE